MPCTYEETSYEKSKKRLNNVNQLKSLTQFLCYCLRILSPEIRTRLLNGNHDLKNWWVEHERADQERLQKEIKTTKQRKIREKAINKLTKEERIALGLNTDI